MNLLLVGCSHRTAPVAIRERLSIPEPRIPATLVELMVRFGGEAAVLSTCNRLELYLVPADAASLGIGTLSEFLADWLGVDAGAIAPHCYESRDEQAVRHLFRVASSLDSMVVGEGQIAGQVKSAYEQAGQCGAAGATLHALFQHARKVARRVRSETDIAAGHASISSVAVDYVRQVFEYFGDKTVLVIGAGKMGRVTLKHLRELSPKKILVTNRSPERAMAVAAGCGGQVVPWEGLDDALARADIVLSTTGASEPVVSRARFERILARRNRGSMVILDIAVPRDFDPAIHDGDRVCLFNIDDLQRIRERTLAERQKHIAPATAIVEQETKRFSAEWARRSTGPVIAQLTGDFDRKRKEIVEQMFVRLNGRLTDADRQTIERAFRLLQNQFLHGPISAVGDAARDGNGGPLLDAVRRLFRLAD